jgi:hypothetical protein
MTHDRRLLAGVLGLTLALAACGGGGAASPAATGQAAETSAPTTEPAATPSAEATEGPEATDEPTGGGDDGPLNDLAAMLPEEAGGVTFERAGYNGDQLGTYGALMGVAPAQLDPILEANGKTRADFNFAIAAPASGSSSAAAIYALQIEGVDATEIMGAMNLDADALPKDTVGGKDVFVQGVGGFGIWAYPKGDVMFVVFLTGGDNIAGAILEKLP